MASTSSSHQENAFSGIEPRNTRREVEGSSRVFDVFINHRGPDVKVTLATQLYNSLKELGILAFLDSEEKELGVSFTSIIETAITSASVHIAIFSKTYAESAWCLTELVLMLQSKAKIIPVFYQVEPRELRHMEKGVYAEAFVKYVEKGRYLEKLDEWREALQQVSFTAGYILKSSDSRDCKDIVFAVQKEVQRTKRLHVAKHPVGLHIRVEEFERRCLNELVQDFESQCGRKKANIVGIFGMGGVGKTTLSLELFNKKRSKYTRACFLYDVREACATGNLPLLQRKLLKDIFSENSHSFPSNREGTSYLRDRLERSSYLSFLIVLDDIDHVEQLEALLPVDILNMHGNNLIIITTRDVGVLATARIDVAYNLKGLDRKDGTELFCWHAFNQPLPFTGYEDLVKDFFNMCGGLPLSLIVLARHVSPKPLREWQEELEKARKALPGDVMISLRISFDALNNEEQQIFMDIACFFIGKPVTEAMSIWRGSGWEATRALETLKRKCLVEEVEEKYPDWLERSTFRMHDHLRDLGREIADGISHPHRLWRPQVLKSLESKGFRNIVAETKDRCFHRIVDKFIGSKITYFLGGPDTSLLWLQVEYPRYRPVELSPDINSNIFSRIPLQNLQYLIMSNVCFQNLWQTDVKVPPNLKELQITRCKNLKKLSATPDLCKLVELKISECQELEELGLAHMSCLEKVSIENCDQLKIVSGITNLAELVELKISGCDMLEFENLCLRDMKYLETVTVNRYVKMKYFVLDGCENLKTIVSDCKNIVNLSIRACEELEKLPELTGPSCLESIKVDGCGKLKDLRLNDLENLRTVSGNFQREESPSLGRLSCLEQIKIESCEKLKDITLPTKLMWLDVQSCRDLQTVAVDHDFTKLTRLIIKQCPALQELSTLDRLSFLEEIVIDSCERLQFIMLPTTLMELDVQNCRDLQMIVGADDLTDLRQLIIKQCPALVELPSFARPSSFEEIVIDSCENLQKIAGIQELHASKNMNLSYCGGAVIRNCIDKLQSVPSYSTVLIGRAADGADSCLSEDLFCDVNIGIDGVVEIGTHEIDPEWSGLRAAIIVSFLVVVDSSTSVEDINKSLSDYGITVRRGEWIITMVAGDDEKYSYLQESEDVLWRYGIVKKRFWVEVKKSEEHKSVVMLRSIVHRLYD